MKIVLFSKNSSLFFVTDIYFLYICSSKKIIMFKFNLGRQTVVQTHCSLSNEQKKAIEESKKTNHPPKNFSVSSAKDVPKAFKAKDVPKRKAPFKRRNKLNFSQATRSKISNSLDAIFLFRKELNERYSKKNHSKIYGYFYEFYLPKECLHSSYSLNRDLFSKFLENLSLNYSLKIYTWVVKHDNQGNPYYLLYTPDEMDVHLVRSCWFGMIQKYFFYDSSLQNNPNVLAHYIKNTVVTSKNCYYKKVKYHFLKRNIMPFSACKRFITREVRIYRSFGRTQKLADILPLSITLDGEAAEKFIGQLNKYSTAYFNETYYVIYHLSSESYWYQHIYTAKLQKMLYRSLMPLYELELTG